MSERPQTPVLDQVSVPADLKRLSDAELHRLADELRAETISAVSETGGHLGAGLGVVELAKKFEGAGVSAIIYTDIDRDGILTGINWDATIELANSVSIPVIASGGLASLEDIRKLASPECGKLEGAITGRALYDGRLDAREALAVLSGQDHET